MDERDKLLEKQIKLIEEHNELMREQNAVLVIMLESLRYLR